MTAKENINSGVTFAENKTHEIQQKQLTDAEVIHMNQSQRAAEFSRLNLTVFQFYTPFHT